MYIPKKMKLNKFRVVQIPSGKEIFTRFGVCSGSRYSGDDVVPPQMTKTDQAAAADTIVKRKVKESEVEES